MQFYLIQKKDINHEHFVYSWHRIGISVSGGRVTPYFDCAPGEAISFKRSMSPEDAFSTEGILFIGRDLHDSPEFKVIVNCKGCIKEYHLNYFQDICLKCIYVIV